MITSVALRVRRRVEASYDAWSVGSFIGRRGPAAGLGAGRDRAGHRAAVRRGGDADSAWRWPGPGALGRRLLGGRCLLVCGWQGAHGPRRGGAEAGARRRAAAGPVARARLGEVALRRAAPARRPAGPRRARRDARDGDDVEQPGAALPRGARRAARAPRRLPHLAPVSDGRLAVLHRARRASPTIRSRSGQRSRPRRAGRSSTPAARSPTTTRSAATTRRTCGDEVGELGMELLRAMKIRCDPAGIMNPGKLLLAAGCAVGRSPLEDDLAGFLGALRRRA